jgi:hypothetical protein
VRLLLKRYKISSFVALPTSGGMVPVKEFICLCLKGYELRPAREQSPRNVPREVAVCYPDLPNFPHPGERRRQSPREMVN